MIKIDQEIIWLIRGSQRKMVFLNLPKEPFMPNRLRKELNGKLSISLSLREVSRHLRDLEKKKLIRCLNSDDPYNKLYILIEKGIKIRKKIEMFEKTNKGS